MNKKKSQMNFAQLMSEDLDLTMFMITNLTLTLSVTKEKNANMVYFPLSLQAMYNVQFTMHSS